MVLLASNSNQGLERTDATTIFSPCTRLLHGTCCHQIKSSDSRLTTVKKLTRVMDEFCPYEKYVTSEWSLCGLPPHEIIVFNRVRNCRIRSSKRPNLSSGIFSSPTSSSGKIGCWRDEQTLKRVFTPGSPLGPLG